MLTRSLLFALLATASEALTLVGNTGLISSSAASMAVYGDYVYSVRYGLSDVLIFNTADKTMPAQETTTLHDGSSTRSSTVLVDGSHLYVLYGFNVVLYNLSPNPAAPVEMQRFVAPISREAVVNRVLTQSADHIFATFHHVGSNTEMLVVLEKGTLSQVGSFTYTGLAMNMVYHDGKLYTTAAQVGSIITTGDLIYVFDVTTPASPSQEAAWEVPFLLGINAQFHRIVVHEGSLYLSRGGNTFNAVPWKIDLSTGVRQAMSLPADVQGCYDILFHNSKMYAACFTLYELQETSAGTFIMSNSLNSVVAATIAPDGNYLYSGEVGDKLRVIDITPPVVDATVELVGGNPLVVQTAGGEGSSVEDGASGQRWEGLPSWLAGSTAHMGAHGKKGMSLKMTCPAGGSSCTFYVVIHNCLPCSSDTNGGLPHGLLNEGFKAGSCGPKYVPTFRGAPSDKTLPTAIFKLEVGAGTPPVEVPVIRDLLHFSVFLQVGAGINEPFCKKATGPSHPRNGAGASQCTCFSPPVLVR
eukprot:TRINITY_DN914_c0_g1_i1.p1 TRINITY_DN914_c0_g1~~TRINITY_DN914_c0_g1_i1.p1  ORF type:complete len:527 (+),score=81.54 TRINITY_DN914_c0_g1_i1:43-1623(+)